MSVAAARSAPTHGCLSYVRARFAVVDMASVTPTTSGTTHDGDETKASGPLRVTETPNSMTMDIDVVSPEGAVRLLRQADAQNFAGWKTHTGLNDPDFLERVERAVAAAVDVLKAPDSAIVLTGCGTSGRMAFWAARTFNAVLARQGQRPAFKYLISGGDPALLLSDELPEDDPHLGMRELKACTEGCSRSMFVGITCGISAAYVLGQVEYGMQTDGMTTVLMGFNPPELARNMPVDGWGTKTCRDVALALEAASDANNILLTPVIGPEPITGSTRMKGGTVTKILLEVVFSLAIRRLYGEPVYPLESLAPVTAGETTDDTKAEDVVADEVFDDGSVRFHEPASVLQAYEMTMRRTYLFQRGIGKLAALAGASLKSGGHLYYVGGEVGGVLGLVDASEMPDTYGSPFDEVRGFTTNGWLSVGNVTGDMKDKGEFFRIDHETFKTEIVPKLTSNDVVIAVGVETEDVSPLPQLVALATEKGARTGLLYACLAPTSHVGRLGCSSSSGDGATSVDADTRSTIAALCKTVDAQAILALPFLHLMRGVTAYAEIALKWALNCISTIGQVAKGCVYTNRMINVGVLNNKLFYRAINLVRQFSGADYETARDSLLKVIHEVDELSHDIESLAVTQHIIVATPKKLVVPITMLLATGRFTRSSAKEALEKEPVLRNIVSGLVTESEA